MIGVALNVKIPGLDTNAPDLATYLEAIFSFLVWGTIILAMLMIIIGGFYYLSSAGNASRASEGKDRIKWAILGLVLALSSYVILSFINPELVSPKLPGFDTKLSADPFGWSDILDNPVQLGEGSHAIPDGQSCLNENDCRYSRKCETSPTNSPWFCPTHPNKLYWGEKGEEKCNKIGDCAGGIGGVVCQQQKICIKLTDAELEGKIAFEGECDPNDPNKNPKEQCYDQGAVCHAVTRTCRKPTRTGNCILPTDCEEGLTCNENGRCVRADGNEPIDGGDEKDPPVKKMVIITKEKIDGITTYRLVQRGYGWILTNTTFDHLSSCLHPNLTTPLSLKNNELCSALGPPPVFGNNKQDLVFDQIIEKGVRLLDRRIIRGEDTWAVGYRASGYQHYKFDDKGIKELKCNNPESYGNLFSSVPDEYCPASTPVDFGRQTINECCAIDYVCCASPSNDSFCERTFGPEYGVAEYKREKQIEKCQELYNGDIKKDEDLLVCCSIKKKATSLPEKCKFNEDNYGATHWITEQEEPDITKIDTKCEQWCKESLGKERYLNKEVKDGRCCNCIEFNIVSP